MKLNLLKTLLLTCLLGVWGANVHAAEVYYFSVATTTTRPSDFSTTATTNPNTFTVDNVEWTLTATFGTSGQGYWSWDTAGIHMGSNNNPHRTTEVTTSDLSSHSITQIIVDAHAGNANATVTLSVKVGDQTFTCNGSESVTLTSSATTYTFEYAAGATGEINISYSQPSTSYAFYLTSIEVFDADTHADAELAFSEDYLGCYVGEVGTKAVVFPYLTYVDGFDGLSEMTYSSSDTSVATVADDGTVTLTGTAGSSTITATFDGNDTYAAGHATYDITVKDGTIYTFDFALYTYGMTVYSGNDSSYEQNVTEITGKNGSTMSFNQGEHYRLWQGTSGNELRIMTSSFTDFTISAPQGATIAGITIAGGQYVQNFTTDSGTYSGSSSSATWTGEATSVKFTTSGNNRHDISTIIVTLKDPTSGSFTITEAGYATYYTDYEYTMPSGVTGTTVTDVTKDSEDDDVDYVLTLPWEYEAESTVPAGTALILKGEAKTYEYTITSNNAAAVSSNLLMGATTNTRTYGPNGNTVGYIYYELSVGDNGVGFYYGADGGAAFTSEANKAWLPLSESQARGARFLGFGDGDDTTGISSVESASEKAVSGIYTLQGVRVNDMNQKGVYIVDGKKVLVK